MKNLFSSNVDLSKVDDLVSGTLVPSKVLPVTVTGTGIVKRGTLLYSEDGETFVAFEGRDADPDNDITADEIQAVLLLDVDADDTDSNVGPAAFSGEFNQNVIEKVMEMTLTPIAVHNARAKQLYIAPMNPAPETF
jgi:hypothetical protein